MKEKDEENFLAKAADALSSFCTQYDPAIEATATDYFSSKEIHKIVAEHTGTKIPVETLYSLLHDMGYTYKLEDNEYKWMVKK